MTVLREYIGYPRYRIHSMADPPAQLVERSGGVNYPLFGLFDRQRLDQPRPLQTGSVPNIFPFHDAPPRDEGMHFGVNEACMSWRDTISKIPLPRIYPHYSGGPSTAPDGRR